MAIEINASPKKLIKTSILALVLGVIMLIAYGFWTYNYYKKQHLYVETIGIVVGHKYKLVDNVKEFHLDDYYLYAPVIEYEANGEMLQVTKPEYTKIKTPIGTKIKLKYNKNNPGDVKYVKDKMYVFVPVISGIFVVVGIVFLCVGKAKQREANMV